MDPMLCAVKLIVLSNAIAKEMGGLVTTRIFHTIPSSINTMAHAVIFRPWT